MMLRDFRDICIVKITSGRLSVLVRENVRFDVLIKENLLNDIRIARSMRHIPLLTKGILNCRLLFSSL